MGVISVNQRSNQSIIQNKYTTNQTSKHTFGNQSFKKSNHSQRKQFIHKGSNSFTKEAIHPQNKQTNTPAINKTPTPATIQTPTPAIIQTPNQYPSPLLISQGYAVEYYQPTEKACPATPPPSNHLPLTPNLHPHHPLKTRESRSAARSTSWPSSFHVVHDNSSQDDTYSSAIHHPSPLCHTSNNSYTGSGRYAFDPSGYTKQPTWNFAANVLPLIPTILHALLAQLIQLRYRLPKHVAALDVLLARR